MRKPSILNNKHYSEASVFNPKNLLRESRRQNNIPKCDVPKICVLDPDGDLVDWLKKEGKASKDTCWACYHSELYTFDLSGTKIGVIPCAVGASYAVLVAEQLFVSGCELLISFTSAGIISEKLVEKKFALITEAIRDEGTSYHYLPPEESSRIPEDLQKQLRVETEKSEISFFEAKSWTTDAPYRETQSAIQSMKEEDIVCVEMEASALYAFAKALEKKVICFAHLTNTMAQSEGDFEKGEEFGSLETIDLISEVINLMKLKKH